MGEGPVGPYCVPTEPRARHNIRDIQQDRESSTNRTTNISTLVRSRRVRRLVYSGTQQNLKGVCCKLDWKARARHKIRDIQQDRESSTSRTTNISTLVRSRRVTRFV